MYRRPHRRNQCLSSRGPVYQPLAPCHLPTVTVPSTVTDTYDLPAPLNSSPALSQLEPRLDLLLFFSLLLLLLLLAVVVVVVVVSSLGVVETVRGGASVGLAATRVTAS